MVASVAPAAGVTTRDGSGGVRSTDLKVQKTRLTRAEFGKLMKLQATAQATAVQQQEHEDAQHAAEQDPATIRATTAPAQVSMTPVPTASSALPATGMTSSQQQQQGKPRSSPLVPRRASSAMAGSGPTTGLLKKPHAGGLAPRPSSRQGAATTANARGPKRSATPEALAGRGGSGARTPVQRKASLMPVTLEADDEVMRDFFSSMSPS
jgi:hypothetical protein